MQQQYTDYGIRLSVLLRAINRPSASGGLATPRTNPASRRRTQSRGSTNDATCPAAHPHPSAPRNPRTSRSSQWNTSTPVMRYAGTGSQCSTAGLASLVDRSAFGELMAFGKSSSRPPGVSPERGGWKRQRNYAYAKLHNANWRSKSTNKRGRPSGRPRFPAPSTGAAHFTAFTMSKIGRYIATIMPPTTTPRNTIITGSSRESSALTAASTSSS